MSKQITIPDALYAQLQSLAEPFVDHEPLDVIRKAIDHYARTRLPHDSSVKSGSELVAPVPVSQDRSLASRLPRARHVVVQIGNKRIDAVSVPDLYKQSLQLLLEGDTSTELKKILPVKTSNERYLVARTPIHPNKNPFVVPVEVQGIYMEAHKSYKTAVAHLRMLCDRLGLTLTYLG